MKDGMEVYKELEMEIFTFSAEDIVTASGDTNGEEF